MRKSSKLNKSTIISKNSKIAIILLKLTTVTSPMPPKPILFASFITAMLKGRISSTNHNSLIRPVQLCSKMLNLMVECLINLVGIFYCQIGIKYNYICSKSNPLSGLLNYYCSIKSYLYVSATQYFIKGIGCACRRKIWPQ